MSLRSSGAAFASVLALATTTLVFEPSAAAQGRSGGAARKGDPKKADTAAAPAPSAVAPATAATTPPPAGAAPEPEPKPADADQKEDKRAIYISVDLGFSRADVGALSDNTGFNKTAANGVLAGIGLGYRYQELRIGARFRDTSTTEFSLWSLMGEIGYGLPLRPLSPIFVAHAGYMFDSGIERSVIAGSLPRGNVLTPNVDLDGLVVGGEIFGSVWLTKFLRAGPFIGVDLTFLHRSQVALPQSIVPLDDATRNNPLFKDSGSGAGYMLNIGLRGTGDIAF
jgi:hypothetical protein